MQANWFKQYHAGKKHTKTHMTLTYDLDVSSYMFVQNFIKLSATAHELAY